MKKITKYGIGIVALSVVATTIAVPVSISVNKKDKVYNDEPPKKTDPLFNTTLGDWLKSNKEEAMEDTNFIETSKNAQALFLYNKEQVGSIQLQKMNLEFQYYENGKANSEMEKENTKLKEENKSYPDKKKLIEKNNKKIESNEKKIMENMEKNVSLEKLINSLNKPNDLNYDDKSFKKDFPMILLPLEKIEKDQKIRIDEEEQAYGKNYRDKGDWKQAWIEKLRKEHNGAVSNEEAAKNAVVPFVLSVAENTWNVGVNSDYTFEHTVAEYKGNKIYVGDGKIFKPNANGKLDVAIAKDVQSIDINDKNTSKNEIQRKLSSKIYFVGSKSKIPSEIFKDISKDNEMIQSIAKGHFSTLQHALFDVKPNEKDPMAPWKVKRELVKKLLKVKPGKISGQGPSVTTHLRIEELQNLFKESDVKSENDELKIKTKNFISNATDNSAGTKDKSGTLKTGKLVNVLTGWNPGFTLGLINNEIIPKTKANKDIGDNIIKSLIDGFKDYAYEKKPYGWKSDELIQTSIDLMTDKQFNNQFGSIFRDAFTEKGGVSPNFHSTGEHKLSYITSNGGIVFSTNGIHFIHLKKYVDDQNGSTATDQIVEKMNEDLQLYADGKNNNVIDFSSLFSNFYTDVSKFEILLKDSDFKNELKKGYEKEKTAKTPFDLPDQINQKTNTKYLWKELIGPSGMFKKEIDDTKKIDALEKTYKILGDGIQTYMIGGYDKEILLYEKSSAPDKIYHAALEIGRGNDV